MAAQEQPTRQVAAVAVVLSVAMVYPLQAAMVAQEQASASTEPQPRTVAAVVVQPMEPLAALAVLAAAAMVRMAAARQQPQGRQTQEAAVAAVGLALAATAVLAL
jgi:hypothetical protein